MRDLDVDAESTELPTVLEGISVFQTDGEGGGVEVVAVSQSHLVTTGSGVDIRAVHLIRQVAAVVVTITLVVVGDTPSDSTVKLVRGTGALNLISSVATIVVSVTEIVERDTLAIGTLEVFEWVTSTVEFIRVVTTVVVSVTSPVMGDT